LESWTRSRGAGGAISKIQQIKLSPFFILFVRKIMKSNEKYDVYYQNNKK
jgi:hypothetical protein